MRESLNVTAAGGPTPNADWSASDMSPDLSRSMTGGSLEASRSTILAVYGVLPSLFTLAAQGPLVREAQRHLAQWVLQPIANLMATECSMKLDTEVTVDTMRPLTAFDAGGRARAVVVMVEALARAKEAGVDAGDALKLVNWDD